MTGIEKYWEDTDDEIVKVYKLLNNDDQVIVNKSDDNKVNIKDNETGAEYLIDLGDDGASEDFGGAEDDFGADDTGFDDEDDFDNEEDNDMNESRQRVLLSQTTRIVTIGVLRVLRIEATESLGQEREITQAKISHLLLVRVRL